MPMFCCSKYLELFLQQHRIVHQLLLSLCVVIALFLGYPLRSIGGSRVGFLYYLSHVRYDPFGCLSGISSLSVDGLYSLNDHCHRSEPLLLFGKVFLRVFFHIRLYGLFLSYCLCSYLHIRDYRMSKATRYIRLFVAKELFLEISLAHLFAFSLLRMQNLGLQFCSILRNVCYTFPGQQREGHNFQSCSIFLVSQWNAPRIRLLAG